jgi:hypothetical protein
MMDITRTSGLTGKTRTMRLDVIQDQLDNWEGGMLAQDAFPTLSVSEREFIMTGITDAEWPQAPNEPFQKACSFPQCYSPCKHCDKGE